MEDLKTVGERIRYARKLKGLTQTDIYNLIGISSGNLSDIENGKSLPSASALISLKRELGTSIDWILTGEKSAIPNKPHRLVGNVGKLSPVETDIILKYRKLSSSDKEEISAFVDLKYNKIHQNTDSTNKEESSDK